MIYPTRSVPTRERIVRHLLHANEVGRHAMEHGHHPFGGILVAPDEETVLMTQGNINTVEHSESVLLRRAARAYKPDFLWQCTVYASVEPCAMCSGTAYWANVGCFVFGMTEARLLELTGDHSENPTMHVGSRYVFDHGQKPIVLVGPVPEVEDAVVGLHAPFWSKLQSGK